MRARRGGAGLSWGLGKESADQQGLPRVRYLRLHLLVLEGTPLPPSHPALGALTWLKDSSSE